MEKSVSNNILKALTGVMLFAVPMLVACEKENTASTNDDGTGDNTQPKHNVELIYGANFNAQWQNISLDTLYKYNEDKTVDSIFMIPEKNTQYAALNANQVNMIVPKLRERHNVNPKKVFGKGDLELSTTIVSQNPEIIRFFADTLKYNVIYNSYYKKTR